jgi:hypothetical protein
VKNETAQRYVLRHAWEIITKYEMQGYEGVNQTKKSIPWYIHIATLDVCDFTTTHQASLPTSYVSKAFIIYPRDLPRERVFHLARPQGRLGTSWVRLSCLDST